jgi:hypothetical protein
MVGTDDLSETEGYGEEGDIAYLSEDSNDQVEEAVEEDDVVEIPGLTESWTYEALSEEGAQYARGARYHSPSKPLTLKYNSLDKWLLQRAVSEAKNALAKVRAKTKISSNTPVSVAQVFASVVPNLFFYHFQRWLDTATKEPKDTPFPRGSDIVIPSR